MAFVVLTIVIVMASRAMAQGGASQLETPRLTQAAQRGEFGVEGPESAFKFNFADPVRYLSIHPSQSV